MINIPVQTRSKITPCDPQKGHNVDIFHEKCVVCGIVFEYLKGAKNADKFRISENERAGKFLKAAVYFQCPVYTQTCDLQDETAVFGADLYCHKNCINNYLKRYEREVNRATSLQPSSEKLEVFDNLLTEIDVGLNSGMGYELSELRVRGNELIATSKAFSNREVRILLENKYGDNMLFTSPDQRSKSAMFFLEKHRPKEMAELIRTTDSITKCALSIRGELSKVTFDLKDQFCDASDLEEA